MADYIDLTHTFRDRMPVFPGDPPARLTSIADVARDGYSNHLLDTGLHTGTHIDAPLHMLAGGARISEIAPERCIGRGRLIDARGCAVAGRGLLEGAEVHAGDIVLILTGHSALFGQPGYFHNYPEVGEDFASALINLGIGMLGLDTPSPDREPYPIHKMLLNNGIPIIENLTGLDALIGVRSFEVIALPVKLDADGAPARVIARSMQREG